MCMEEGYKIKLSHFLLFTVWAGGSFSNSPDLKKHWIKDSEDNVRKSDQKLCRIQGINKHRNPWCGSATLHGLGDVKCFFSVSPPFFSSDFKMWGIFSLKYGQKSVVVFYFSSNNNRTTVSYPLFFFIIFLSFTATICYLLVECEKFHFEKCWKICTLYCALQ
jgi:hypothetical protein